MVDVIVIGAGIIGCTIAKALQNQGREVLILDSAEPLAGTKASGGHIRFSWSDLEKEVFDSALETLEKVWGDIHQQDYKIVTQKGAATMYRIDTEQVLSTPITKAKVIALSGLETNAPSVTCVGSELRCRLLIVAAGIWSKDLLKGYFPYKELVGKQGVSFLYSGKLEYPFIKMWAPYKQIVAHQQDENRMWVGDGTAILPKNWNDNIVKKSKYRCQLAVNHHGTLEPEEQQPKIRLGIRPYCNTSGPCLLEKIGKATYVVTGAGKRGTIAAGWAANIIVQEAT